MRKKRNPPQDEKKELIEVKIFECGMGMSRQLSKSSATGLRIPIKTDSARLMKKVAPLSRRPGARVLRFVAF